MRNKFKRSKNVLGLRKSKKNNGKKREKKSYLLRDKNKNKNANKMNNGGKKLHWEKKFRENNFKIRIIKNSK